MRRPTDPDYDPRTLFIPPHAWKKFTAFETQFWQVKAAHWDTIVMFKKGKFYECYEKDADIAHQIFDWKLTDRVNMKMTGVPENSFDHWASQFVAKGYKVARVDQVETLIGKEMREKANGIKKKEDNIIRRELTAVLTTGTLVDSNLLSNDMSTYCMSLTEFNADSANPKFLVCFADTATADFKLSTFDDDIDRSVFETLLMQIKPRELIIEKGSLSKIALQMIKNNLSNPQLNFLASGHEFWDHDRTVLELETGGYFKESTPRELKSVIEQDGSLTALGGMISYLKTVSSTFKALTNVKKLKLDKELVSIGNFSTYDPVGDSGTLILDGKTLSNLEIFDNESDHTEAGTLFRLVNHCLSSCGKRLLKKWITHPLRNVKEINARLDAVEDLVRLTKLRDLLAKCLRSLPDMERIISRVHAGNCKVKDFIAVLQGFNDIFETVNEAKESLPDLKSVQLIELLSNGFPNALQEQLKYYESSFDQSESLEEGDIVINEGYDEIYDEANKAVELIEAEFESYRVKQERELRTKLVYKDVGKDLFQLETPSKIRTPDDWKLMSKTKAVNRYHTPRIQSLTRKFLEAKEVRENAKKEVRSRLYQKFDGKYAGWLSVIRNMSILDCLCSLTFCRLSMGSPVCRPQFAEGKQRVLDFEELRHPCIVSDVGKDFIPNDIALGSGEASMILLTGPNMGGKSTLLRQTCIAVIMAQIGCFVPASSCVISPFDRIFTRLGANDNIMSGQSTFMVELSETSRILKEATPNSLVVLDELGRGTSTFDGYAIAFSVLRHLLLETRCLGLFSTHYGMLTSEFMDNKLVSLSFMNFISDEENREVTFLYKLAKGACPKSFGMNVASMAGISSDIVDCADEVASSFEKSLRLNNIRDVSLHSVKMSRQADFASLWKTNQDVLLPLLQSL
ncbi:muts domain V-domain-containing protein [Chytridium lagenaria]|nr:muts domain V-domain-containing protein [Chytridium lagenaria]